MPNQVNKALATLAIFTSIATPLVAHANFFLTTQAAMNSFKMLKRAIRVLSLKKIRMRSMKRFSKVL